MSADIIVCVGSMAAPDGGGLKAADYIALVAAATGIVGAYAGVQAFVVSDRSLKASILRDEFAAHRQFMQENISAIEQVIPPLRQTINPNQPVSRIEANFGQVQNEVRRRVFNIADEAQKISERGLFKGAWDGAFRRSAQKVERDFDAVLDDSKPEGIRRASASDIVDDLSAIAATARRMIDDTVKAPLLQGKFRWPWSKE